MSEIMVAICVCGNRPLVLRIHPTTEWWHVRCPECYRAGPKKHSRAFAVCWWNEETTAIKNPRDDLAPQLDQYRVFYGPMQGKGND
jgi:hypothetical protein